MADINIVITENMVVGPDDKLVIHLSEETFRSHVDLIAEKCAEMFGAGRVMVIGGGDMEVTVVRGGEPS